MTTMRWMRRQAYAAGLISAAAVLSTSACADNESSLFVASVLAVVPPDCAVKADPSSTMLLGGTLDLALAQSYRGALLIGNQLVRRGSRDQLRTETARVSLRGAEVHVDASGGGEIASFTVDGTGFVNPGSSDEPGYGVMSVTLIPPQAAATLRANYVGRVVTIRVKVFGRTLGGTELESSELFFPVAICSGCLVSFPLEADDPSTAGYDCYVDAQSGSSFSGEDFPCRLGQDDLVDCRACVANHPDVCTSP